MRRKHQQGWHTKSAAASEKQVENEGCGCITGIAERRGEQTHSHTCRRATTQTKLQHTSQRGTTDGTTRRRRERRRGVGGRDRGDAASRATAALFHNTSEHARHVAREKCERTRFSRRWMHPRTDQMLDECYQNNDCATTSHHFHRCFIALLQWSDCEV